MLEPGKFGSGANCGHLLVAPSCLSDLLEPGKFGSGANCGHLSVAPSWLSDSLEEVMFSGDKQGHAGAGAQRLFPVAFSSDGVMVCLGTFLADLFLPPFSILLAYYVIVYGTYPTCQTVHSFWPPFAADSVLEEWDV